jgi:phosphoribosylaminoimidazolecarboxamide formyltransferase / IMP cyclohydrolase
MTSSLKTPKQSLRKINRALVSVSDKTGLEHLARTLAKHGVELLSTGGTAKTLRGFGLAVTDVANVTGFPEIMDGRVKTLHPKIHGGLLSMRNNPDHEQQRQTHAIELIDLLVVNLYAFEETVAAGGSYDETVENIDIGGPAMIRAAAKNHDGVAVVVNPKDYEILLAEMDENKGQVSLALRRQLAATAFARTAAYDSAIAQWMAGQVQQPFPAFIGVGGKKHQELRYGENPHQQAAVYRAADGRLGVLDAKQVQGKELSYNNINDADAALDAVSAFHEKDAAACVIVKHANPCGVAISSSLSEAYLKALACDTVSAFGGIIAVNRKLDAAAAREISNIFTEVILAPGADDESMHILAAKKNLRLLLLPRMPSPDGPSLALKTIAGGLLVQSNDSVLLKREDLKVVTKRQPSAAEMKDLLFAWTVAKHVKSNAIIFAKDGRTTGIGAGQMSRIDSTRIAVSKSLDAAKAQGRTVPDAEGSVLASDAFFPFPDGVEAAADAGATAIIQPGGAMKDQDVIAAADARGLAMVFTGLRHFKH